MCRLRAIVDKGNRISVDTFYGHNNNAEIKKETHTHTATDRGIQRQTPGLFISNTITHYKGSSRIFTRRLFTFMQSVVDIYSEYALS